MRLSIIKRSTFLRNVTTLISGTAFAQVINILSTPILTRIYSPEEFAVFQIFYSIATSISVIATFRYEMAIVNPDNEEETLDLISICFYSSFFVAFLSFIAIYMWYCISKLEASHFTLYYLIPLYILLSGLMQTMNYLSLRSGTFSKNMRSRIGSSFGSAATSIGLGLSGIKPAGLMIGSIIGQLIGFSLLFKSVPNVIIRPFFSAKTIRFTLRKYKKYPIYNTPHVLVDVLQDNIIIILLKSFFQITTVAFYGQAIRILKAPLNFIGSSIFDVLYPKFNEMARRGEDIRPIVKSIYFRLSLFGLPFFSALFLFGEEAFSLFLGNDWKNAGQIAQILSPWLFLNFLVSPVSCLALIRDKQDIAAAFTITNAILRIGAILIGVLFSNSNFGFILMSVLGSLIYIIILFWYYKLGSPTIKKNEILHSSLRT